MTRKQLLKEKLIQIKQEQYQVPKSMNPFEIAIEMMNYIGDVDPELRDDLIYATFAHWVNEGVFNEKRLKKLLLISLDEQHLFYGIGEKNTDSVFTRSFSVLLIPLVMSADRKNPFLSQEDVLMIKNKLVRYIVLEQDVRGYVGDEGWAHAVAHSADAFEDIAQSPFIRDIDLIDMLDAIQSKIFVNDHIYINEEDERNVTAVISILNREVLKDQDVHHWIQSFGNRKLIGKRQEDDILNKNIKCFLRSLYFRIIEQPQLNIFMVSIVSALQSLESN